MKLVRKFYKVMLTGFLVFSLGVPLFAARNGTSAAPKTTSKRGGNRKGGSTNSLVAANSHQLDQILQQLTPERLSRQTQEWLQGQDIVDSQQGTGNFYQLDQILQQLTPGRLSRQTQEWLQGQDIVDSQQNTDNQQQRALVLDNLSTFESLDVEAVGQNANAARNPEQSTKNLTDSSEGAQQNQERQDTGNQNQQDSSDQQEQQEANNQDVNDQDVRTVEQNANTATSSEQSTKNLTDSSEGAAQRVDAQQARAVGSQQQNQDNQAQGPQGPLNTGKVLDTSHEHTFIARSVARMLQTKVESEVCRNVLNCETLNGDHQMGNREPWVQLLHGHSHKKSSGLPHNGDTVGMLVGYNYVFGYQQRVGLFAGITSTNINYKNTYHGTYGKQKGYHVGACVSTQIGQFLINDTLCLSRSTCSDDIKGNPQLNIADSHVKYSGVSCFNKLAISTYYQYMCHVFYPEVVIYCDYITQGKHSHSHVDQILTKNARTHDFFTTCSLGVHYLPMFDRNIQPHVFVGYEFSLKNKPGKRFDSQDATLWSSPVSKDCIILDMGVSFKLLQQYSLTVGYTGNHRKHCTSHWTGVSFLYQF